MRAKALDRRLAEGLDLKAARRTRLAPLQAVVLNITDRQAEYAKQVEESLKNQGVRVRSDLRNEKIGFKIREHTIQRVPYLVVVGDREVESNTVAVRTRSGKDLGILTLQAFAEGLSAEIASHGQTILETQTSLQQTN